MYTVPHLMASEQYSYDAYSDAGYYVKPSYSQHKDPVATTPQTVYKMASMSQHVSPAYPPNVAPYGDVTSGMPLYVGNVYPSYQQGYSQEHGASYYMDDGIQQYGGQYEQMYYPPNQGYDIVVQNAGGMLQRRVSSLYAPQKTYTGKSDQPLTQPWDSSDRSTAPDTLYKDVKVSRSRVLVRKYPRGVCSGLNLGGYLDQEAKCGWINCFGCCDIERTTFYCPETGEEYYSPVDPIKRHHVSRRLC